MLCPQWTNGDASSRQLGWLRPQTTDEPANTGRLGTAQHHSIGPFVHWDCGVPNGVALPRRAPARLLVDALDHRRDALADADAHRREPVAAAGSAQLVDEHRDQAAAAHP